MASPFLSALASIGSQYAEGTAAGKQQKLENEQKEQQFEADKSYRDYQQRYLDYQMRVLADKEKTGELLNTKWGLYNPQTQKWIKPPAADPNAFSGLAFQHVLASSNLTPQQKQQAQDVVQMEMENDPANPNAAYKAGWSFVKSEQDKAATQQESEKKAKQAEQWRREDMQERFRQSLDSRLELAYILAAMKPSAQEGNRADLARNVNENLNTIEDIARRRPDLFGPGWGRITQLRAWIGTSDTDIANLKQAEDNLGRALTGAHGMRAASTLETAGNGVLNNFRNGSDATLSAIETARHSVKTFSDDIIDKLGYGAGILQRRGITVPPPPGSTTAPPPTATSSKGGTTGVSADQAAADDYVRRKVGLSGTTTPGKPPAAPATPVVQPPPKPSAGIPKTAQPASGNERNLLERGGHFVGEIVQYNGRKFRVTSVNAQGNATGTELP